MSEGLRECGNCRAPAMWVMRAWRIKCTRPSCGVEGGIFETKSEAIAAWNTREPDVVALLREALLTLEQACEQLAATRTHEVYLAMIDNGQAGALLQLDCARRSARAALGGNHEAE